MKKIFTSKLKVSYLRSLPFLLALLMTPLLSFGQDLEVISQPTTVDIQGDFGYNTYRFMEDARAGKIGAGLLAVKDLYENGRNLEPDTTILVVGNKIMIQAFAQSADGGEELLASLTDMGMTNGQAHKHIVNGMFPFDKINDAGFLPALRSMSFAVRPRRRVGAVTSQAVQAMGADQVSATAGVNGSGVKIGILSDAYNSLGGAPAGVASGDLPGVGNPNGFTTPVQVLEEILFGPGIDEGRAMAELVHDVAPGATLAFNSAFNGIAGFANGIINLRLADCDIIVDDIFYFAQPYFQDDVIGQAADAVVNDGAMYFSSAGNSGNESYDEAYNPGGFLFDFGPGLVYEPHDWGGGDYFLEVTLAPGEGIDFWLQWDEPSLLAGLIGPSQDLDILIFNEDLTALIDGSFFDNPGDGLPVEFIRGGNGGATPLKINILVGRWAPVPGNPNRIKFIDFAGDGSNYENAAQVTKATVVGHPNTEGAIAVGASAYFNTPEFGVSPALINGFSSVGGTPILFDPIGNRLATPQDRLKPDLTGPDGTNTTFFGFDIEPDGFPNFFGTSASAPNVAALAALLKEATPDLSGKTIESVLKETALDMDDPRGVHSNLGDTTFDYATGFGFVNGVAALAKVKSIPTMSQWGLALFLLLITSLSLTTIYSVKFASALSSGSGQINTRPGFKLHFDRKIFYQKLPHGLLTLAVGVVAIFVFWGEMLPHDIVGLVLALPLVTYIFHMVEVLKEDK